jgi:hypothetical protein
VGPAGVGVVFPTARAEGAAWGAGGGAARGGWAARLARSRGRLGRRGARSGKERGGKGRLGRTRGEGAAGPKREKRGERKEKGFPFSLNLDECFSQFQSNKTNAWLSMVQQTKIKYF